MATAKRLVSAVEGVAQLEGWLEEFLRVQTPGTESRVVIELDLGEQGARELRDALQLARLSRGLTQ